MSGCLVKPFSNYAKGVKSGPEVVIELNTVRQVL